MVDIFICPTNCENIREQLPKNDPNEIAIIKINGYKDRGCLFFP